MPGFGEQMRQISLHFVPTAILSRQVGVIRKQALILNLPGQPKSIKETLEGVKDAAGNVVVHGIFASYRTAFSCWKGHTLKRHRKWLQHSDRRVRDATLANKKIPPSGGISKQLVGFTNRQNGATKLLVQYFTHRQIDCAGTADQPIQPAKWMIAALPAMLPIASRANSTVRLKKTNCRTRAPFSVPKNINSVNTPTDPGRHQGTVHLAHRSDPVSASAESQPASARKNRKR